SSLVINFGQLAGALLVSVLVLPVWVGLGEIQWVQARPGWGDLVYLLILALLCTVLPYLRIVDLLRKFSAFTLNLSINMEPIYGIFMAWAVFGEAEKMSVQFYAGAVLILLSLVLNVFWTRKK